MDFIQDMQAKIKALKGQLPVMMRDVVKKRELDIIQHYQDNQLLYGIKKGARKDGVFIRNLQAGNTTYAPATQEYWEDYWRPQTPPYDKDTSTHFDLNWSGKMWAAMYISFPNKYTYEINSRDNKVPMLLKSYGDFFSLTEEVRLQVEKTYITPDFTKLFNERFSAIV